jgi:hypothetical protein
MLLVVPQHLASLLLAAMVAVVEELQVVVGDLQQCVWAQRSLIPLPGGDSCLMLDTISSTRPPPQREVAVVMVMCTGDSDARLTVEVGRVWLGSHLGKHGAVVVVQVVELLPSQLLRVLH